jgi:phosphatidylserine/phosphatidylglycerophosphate/cardiolipin synthase-like enzyme
MIKLIKYLLMVSPSILISQDKIKVYFNQSVDNSISTFTDAITTINIQDTIIKHINNATTTLDICNYNTSRSDIVNAINYAYTRGVNIRYIASKDVPFRNTKLGDLNSSINILQRSGGLPGSDEMHNKFMVIDEADSVKATIISGSLNQTNSSIEDDYNNIIVIQNKPLATAYKIEFEEMWGATGLTHNASNSKFGPNKTDNTQHIFTIDGKTVELYFSPSDNVSTKIKQTIQSANNSVDVAMMTFKDATIANEIITKHNASVSCYVLLHNTSGSSEYTNLNSAGVPTYVNNLSGVLHHKYAIIDANNSSSDPTVITGSQNWNDNTEPDYDDNTLIIHDYKIAQQYLEEFSKRKQNIVSITEGELINSIHVFPNPASDMIEINLNKVELPITTICFNIMGKKIASYIINSYKKNINLSNLKKGIYYFNFTTNKGITTKKIIKL